MQFATYSEEERVADGILHVVGVVAGCIAFLAMMTAALLLRPLPITASLGVYGIGMLAMFSCSAAYNLISSSRWKGLLQRLDHAAIFLKIAGTYTPFGVIMGGVAGYFLIAVVWTVALVGIVGKFFATHWKGIDVLIYLLLGWVGVLAYRPLSEAIPVTALVLLVMGGVLYSAGVVFHLWRNLKYQNAIWHGFVLIATGCHFGAVTTAAFA